MWRPKDKADDPRYTSASMKQGGGSVMAWACITVKGPGDLVFIDDITEDGSSIMDGNTYRKILSKYIEPNGKNLAGRGLIVQSDKDPKHTAKATQEFIAKKKWTLLNWPSQSHDLTPIEHIFYLLKRQVQSENPKNKAKLKNLVLKACKYIKPSIFQKIVHSMPVS